LFLLLSTDSVIVVLLNLWVDLLCPSFDRWAESLAMKVFLEMEFRALDRKAAAAAREEEQRQNSAEDR